MVYVVVLWIMAH